MEPEDRRAFFAGLAMHALLQRADLAGLDKADLATDAWDIADYMIAEEVSDEDSPLAAGLPKGPTEGLKDALRRRR
jgi:hypothetical protein